MLSQKEKMIEDLKKTNKKMMEMFPGSMINRDSYRIYGTFSEKLITQEFGSFTEFKKTLVNDPEMLEMNVRLAKQKQKYQDLNRIERKTFREQSRLDNALEEYSKEIIDLLKKYDLSKSLKIKNTKKSSINNEISAGVVNLSDLHFNEYVEDNGSLNNSYTWEIASQRLKKFAINLKIIFKAYSITSIVIANTGDFVNNDNLLDKALTNITNRTKATILGVYLLEQFILDLSLDFNITIATVSGNETRIFSDYTFSESLASHNYDYTIHNMLKMIFRKNKNILFIDGYYKEKIIDVCGQNFLLLHGDSIKGNLEKWVQEAIARYSVSGINIRYVLFGHIHSTYLSDYFSRSGSLVGGNDYSSKGLNLISKASQNCHIVFNDGTINSIKVDLQTTNNEGYNLIEELKTYNQKSADKINKKNTIYKVIIK